jgi:glycine oxidase
MHVAIIGGGVIGCSIALRLAQAKVQVTILERALPGAEASSAAGGILGAQAESEGDGAFFDLCLESRARYPAFAAELEAISGISVGYLRCGLFDVAFTHEDADKLSATVAAQKKKGLNAELLNGDRARELEPALSPRAVAAASFPDDHQVDNRLLVSALSVAAAKLGVTFRTGVVRGIAREGDRCVGVELEGEELRADAVVVAAGAWTGLVGGLGVPVQAVRPAKGQMVCLKTRAPILQRVLFAHGRYVIPRADGRVIAGSTVEFAGYDKTVSARGLSSILEVALELCPALADAAVIETWAGLRPFTEDHLPILGRGPLEGLFLASGHYRNGILLAPITGELIADCVLGKQPDVDLSPFRPGRLPQE